MQEALLHQPYRTASIFLSLSESVHGYGQTNAQVPILQAMPTLLLCIPQLCQHISRGNHYEEYRDYWENGNYTFSRNENPELVYVRARDIEGVYLSDRELGNPEGFWTRNGREGWSRENILRRASHIQDVRQNTESGMSLDELSQNPVLDDTIRSYYNNPVQVAQVGSYYVFQSDGRHRTLAAQSLDTYIPVLVTGSYTRND